MLFHILRYNYFERTNIYGGDYEEKRSIYTAFGYDEFGHFFRLSKRNGPTISASRILATTGKHYGSAIAASQHRATAGEYFGTGSKNP
jgi:hypothetical protein